MCDACVFNNVKFGFTQLNVYCNFIVHVFAMVSLFVLFVCLLLLTCYQRTRNNEVNVIVLGPPPNMDCIRHIRVRFRAANVNYLISFRREANQIPLPIGDVLLTVAFFRFHLNIYSVTIVRPRAELHGTELNKPLQGVKTVFCCYLVRNSRIQFMK